MRRSRTVAALVFSTATNGYGQPWMNGEAVRFRAAADMAEEPFRRARRVRPQPSPTAAASDRNHGGTSTARTKRLSGSRRAAVAEPPVSAAARARSATATSRPGTSEPLTGRPAGAGAGAGESVGRRGAAVEDMAALAGTGGQARVVQDAQVLGDRARRDPQSTGQFGGGPGFRQEGEQPSPGCAEEPDEGRVGGVGGRAPQGGDPAARIEQPGGSSGPTGGAGLWQKTEGASRSPRPEALVW